MGLMSGSIADLLIRTVLRKQPHPLVAVRTVTLDGVSLARIAVEASKNSVMLHLGLRLRNSLCAHRHSGRGPRSGQILPATFLFSMVRECERMMTADFLSLGMLNRPSLYHVSMLGGRLSDGLVSPLILSS